MSHVNHIVDLRPAAYAGAAQRSAIDTSVGTQFDVVFDHHGANLRELVITHFATDVSEAVRTNNYTRMKDDVITYGYAIFKENVWVNHAIAADSYMVADFCSGADLCSGSHR